MKSGGVQLFFLQKWGGGQILKWGGHDPPAFNGGDAPALTYVYQNALCNTVHNIDQIVFE